MRPSRRVATVIGIVCGAELIVAAIIGGSGLSALFGWNGALVAAVAIAMVFGVVVRRRSNTAPPLRI